VGALSLIAAVPPIEAVGLLGDRLRRLSEQLTELRREVDTVQGRGVHPLFLVEEEYRIALLQAESAFRERFVARITDQATGWGRAWAEATSPGQHLPQHPQRIPSHDRSDVGLAETLP
jgi:hypothetical protein